MRTSDKISHFQSPLSWLSKRPLQEDVAFMTELDAAMQEGIPIRYHLIFALASFFIVFSGIWAYFATLDVITIAEGNVILSQNRQVIQHLEGGVIQDIGVKIGEVVDRDQVLMVVDNTRFSAAMKENDVQRAALEAKSARLEAEATEKDLVFPRALEEQYAALSEGERQVYEARKKELTIRKSLLKEEIVQREQEWQAAKSKAATLQRSVALAEEEWNLKKPLIAEGVLTKIEGLRLERVLNDLEGELQQTQLAISQLASRLLESQEKRDQIVSHFKTEVWQEWSGVRAEYARLTEAYSAVEDRVARTLIRSPVRGTVHQMAVTTLGAVVSPGQTVMEIVPLEDRLLIEAHVRPLDVGFLRPGLEAIVKVSAYDFSIYGGLKAVVEYVSSDSISNREGAPFYQIHVRTTERPYLMGKQGERLYILPGMPVTVDVLTGKKTVLEYLLKPIIKAKSYALSER